MGSLLPLSQYHNTVAIKACSSRNFTLHTLCYIQWPFKLVKQPSVVVPIIFDLQHCWFCSFFVLKLDGPKILCLYVIITMIFSFPYIVIFSFSLRVFSAVCLVCGQGQRTRCFNPARTEPNDQSLFICCQGDPSPPLYFLFIFSYDLMRALLLGVCAVQYHPVGRARDKLLRSGEDAHHLLLR